MDNEPSAMTTTTTVRQTAVVLKQSLVWNYFERINTDEHLKAKCLVDGCGKILATPLHSTSTLMRHLRDVHKLTEFKSKEKLVNRSNTKKISSQLKKKLDHAAIVAIVEDGRSFNDFSKKGFKKFIQLALPSKKIFVIVIYFLCLSMSYLNSTRSTNIDQQSLNKQNADDLNQPSNSDDEEDLNQLSIASPVSMSQCSSPVISQNQTTPSFTTEDHSNNKYSQKTNITYPSYKSSSTEH
jgi:hypothetical protein